MEKIRIGVMGCAAIAQRSVIPAIIELSCLFDLVAVASRTKEKAEQYASLFHCETVVGYEELLKRKDIDAIYMPLPTGLHKEWVMKALSAGKHVYVEKSIARTYEDAKEMVAFAKSKGLALMEGYMFRYHAQHKKVLELLDNGVIGEIRQFSASFGFPPLALDNFRYDPEIGGGALMDCTGYTVSASSFILRRKLQVKAADIFYDERGTSRYGSAFLQGDHNVSASISFGFENFYQCNYAIWGSLGRIYVGKAFTPKANEITKVWLELPSDIIEYEIPADNHFIHALEEFNQCIFSDQRKMHYDLILQQSKLLSDIERISKQS